ncbi:MAG TPA: TRAM domain-containing protein [Candidatus Nanoarchaeia archaeon]|nr:TRAM domain-containing protein [Candidatus Nanoarchaeia archaeon]
MFGQRRRFAPVREGDELDVKIEAVGEKGDGIAKKQGFVLFVPSTKEGDEVRVRVTRVLRNAGFAEVIKGGIPKKPEEGKEEEPAEEEASELEETSAEMDSEDFGEESTEEEPAKKESEDKPAEPEAEEEAKKADDDFDDDTGDDSDFDEKN